MILPWLAACRADPAADFHLTIHPHLLPDQEDDVLALEPDVKLLEIPPDGGAPIVHYAGTASSGSSLELDGLGPIAVGTTLGLVLERPGGDQTVWNRRSTVAYGDTVVSDALGFGTPDVSLDILAERVDAFAKVAHLSGEDRKLAGAAAILPDGRAAVFGGGDPDSTERFFVRSLNRNVQVVSSDAIELTGPTPDGWAPLTPASEPMPVVDFPPSGNDDDVSSGARADAVAVGVQTDAGWRILVTGGRYTYGYSAYNLPDWFLWDPDLGKVESHGKLTSTHSSHLALPLDDDKVLVYGGFQATGAGGTPTYDLLNLKTGKSTLGQHSYDLVGNFAAYGTVLDGDAVICTSGILSGSNASALVTPVDQCVRIDSKDHLTELEPLGEPLFGASIAPLPDGGLLVTGGTTELIQYNALVAPTDDAWRWDPTNGTWRSVSKLRHSRGYHQSTLLSDGRVLVVGGVDQMGGYYGPSGNAVRCAEVFDPDTEEFSETACSDAGAGQEAAVVAAPGYVVALEGLAGPSGAFDGGGTLGALRMTPDLPEE